MGEPLKPPQVDIGVLQILLLRQIAGDAILKVRQTANNAVVEGCFRYRAQRWPRARVVAGISQDRRGFGKQAGKGRRSRHFEFHG